MELDWNDLTPEQQEALGAKYGLGEEEWGWLDWLERDVYFVGILEEVSQSE